ncbi:pilus assembly protein [Cohnella sp.]|uniref:pilus assembly protein n=1 Tax=Cohnella sp. TaxID=1883426 RepID=UPI0037039F58
MKCSISLGARKQEGSRRRYSDSAGSFTIEASMLLPWVMMLTFMLILFALYISQGALLYYSSSIMTERAAFNWSNSSADTRTGGYPEGQVDGLYWRLTDDALLQSLFGLASGEAGTQVEVYPGMAGGEGAAAAEKLKRAAYETSAKHHVGSGQLSYRNIGIKREIHAELISSWLSVPLVRFKGGGPAEAKVSALVVEPAEFVRSFDLVRYYAAKLRNAPEGEEKYRSQAEEVLGKRKSTLGKGGGGT